MSLSYLNSQIFYDILNSQIFYAATKDFFNCFPPFILYFCGNQRRSIKSIIFGPKEGILALLF